MWNNQSVAIGQENRPLPPAVPGGKCKILFNFRLLFYSELLIPVGTAERAAVMGTSDRNLENDRIPLAWRPDNRSFVFHRLDKKNQPFFRAKSAMKSTSLATPSSGKAL